MKKWTIWCLAPLLLLLYTTCFSPLNNKDNGETTLSVTLPGISPGISKAVGVPDLLEYEISGTGPRGKSFAETASGGTTATITIVPGLWRVKIRAYDPLDLTKTNEADSEFYDIDIKAGKNNNLPVQMRFVQIAPIVNYLNAVGGTLANPASLHIAVPLDSTAWNDLLTALDSTPYYVDLDLSACTRGTSTGLEGLDSNGVFDPDSGVVIGKDKIVSLVLPDAADSIADWDGSNPTFNGFINLLSLDTSTMITVIGDNAFEGIGLYSVIIGNKVMTIGDWAFSNNNLTSVIIPNNVIQIGMAAFSNNNLISVTIGNSIITIGNGAFMSNQLPNVTIPNSVTTIGPWAFDDNQLITITIPDSVTILGESAFSRNQLSSITIPDSIIVIEQQMFTANNLASITIPNSVIAINARAFANNQLSTLIIPDSITTIEDEVFVINPLTSVTIGANVTLSTHATRTTFDGDLDDVYNMGGQLAGTYTRPTASSPNWTKEP